MMNPLNLLLLLLCVEVFEETAFHRYECVYECKVTRAKHTTNDTHTHTHLLTLSQSNSALLRRFGRCSFDDDYVDDGGEETRSSSGEGWQGGDLGECFAGQVEGAFSVKATSFWSEANTHTHTHAHCVPTCCCFDVIPTSLLPMIYCRWWRCWWWFLPWCGGGVWLYWRLVCQCVRVLGLWGLFSLIWGALLRSSAWSCVDAHLPGLLHSCSAEGGKVAIRIWDCVDVGFFSLFELRTTSRMVFFPFVYLHSSHSHDANY